MDAYIQENEMSEKLKLFKDVYDKDGNSRYKSFDHCRKCFIENRNKKDNYDLIALNLYAYLASWGMLRNSFLMQKDYLFNLKVVEILCNEKYDNLLNYNPFSATEKDDEMIIKLKEEISNYYKGKKYYSEGNSKKEIKDVSETLISKIILGTFGCIIAYDRYVKAALSNYKIKQTLTKESLLQIRLFAKKYQEEIVDQLGNYDKTIYTPIKIIDTYLFEKGKEIEMSKKHLINSNN